MKNLLFICTCFFSVASFGQKSTAEYPEKQRIALKDFINSHEEYSFIPETWFDEDLLKPIRNEWGFGKNYKPYYQTQDFNKDGIKDFAVILKNNKTTGDIKCAVVVFNGQKDGNYKLAHIEKEDFRDALGLTFQGKQLNVLVFETDNIGCFISAGKGYIVEPCK